MRFPHVVVRLRPVGLDEYGNPANDWTMPARKTLSGFIVEKISSTVNGAEVQRTLLMPAGSDVRAGDRVMVRGTTYLATPTTISSPSKDVLMQVALSPLAGVR